MSVSMPKVKGKFRPINEYCLVRKIPGAERVTKGGIIIPSNAKEKLMTGEILAVGRGYVSANKNVIVPLDVKPGDIVLYNDWAESKPVEVEGEILYLMEEADMHGVMEQEAA